MKYIRCQLSGNVTIDAIPSRRHYVFTPEDNQIEIGTADGQILPEDVPDLLSKHQQYGSCCGGTGQNIQIFIEVEI